MDQEVIFVASEQELDVVDLNQAPTSADQYLKQVMRSRKDCPNVVRVDYRLNIAGDNAGSETSAENRSTDGTNIIFDPPRWWIDKQCADFSTLRETFTNKKMTKKMKVGKIHIPDSNDEDGWREFIFEKCKVDMQDVDSSLELSTKITNCYGPKGTPPLFRVLARMSQPDVANALEFCSAWFSEDISDDDSIDVKSVEKFEGNVTFIRELTQWLFALICAIELPLDPDNCSSLRAIAKQCLKLKEYSRNQNLRLVYDWFICIVAHYFGQKDLLA